MKCKILRINQETPTVKSFRFGVKDLNFRAGQFIILTADNGGRAERRSFSISSSPEEKRYIETAIKLYPEGKLSPFMFEAPEGSEVDIAGPYGRFYYDEEKDIVLIAGGAGITPLISILRCMTDKESDAKATLIYSVKSADEIIYRKELEELSRRNRNIKIEFTATSPDKEWKGRKGRVTKELLLTTIPEVKAKEAFYLCGPPEMVEETAGMIELIGISADKIKKDKW